MKVLPLALLVAVLAPPHVGAQATQAHSAPHAAVVVPAGTAQFGSPPPSLPPGARVAVLEGDPSRPGPFTMRLLMPDGYTIPPHFHPADEHVTVLQGRFLVGMGGTLDTTRFTALEPGSFGMLPRDMQHYARAQGSTEIQLHGVGPWGITYVNPADDPRRVTK